jgi:hypothetical protein
VEQAVFRYLYEADPLICAKCGGEMRVVTFITESPVIKKIVDNLRKCVPAGRAPPSLPPAAA